VIGHLGNRVSALLDGQLSQAESEEAWAHVYACHACRDLVEREGWVKTRLAGLSGGGVGSASSDLKGSLLNLTPGERFLVGARDRSGVRRGIGVAVLGGGALGAAMVGVLALGFTPGSAPADRRPPASRVETPAASEGAATDTPAAPIVPAHVGTPIGTVAAVGGGEWPGAATMPAWVLQLLPR